MIARGLVALLCMIAASAAPCAAQARLQLVEQEIKAGLVYNFLRYTDWPAGATGPHVVCLYGGDPFDGRLAPIQGRTVNQRQITLRVVRSAAEARGCTMLVLGAAERPNWPQVRGALAGAHVLTVSELEGFNNAGGMIQFTRNGDRIGIRINGDAVTAAGLRIDPRLMRLAGGGAPA